MDNERPQSELPARAPEAEDIFGESPGSAPHPRAGGEDLEGVGAQFGGLEGGVFERAGDGGVDAYAQSGYGREKANQKSKGYGKLQKSMPFEPSLSV